MEQSDTQDNPHLNHVKPRETAGRETIARYQAQFRAAAYECLTMLDRNSIDRVYCDHHEDFVSRAQQSGQPIYHFYQAKTKEKRNYQWSKLEIFGLYKSKSHDSKKIANSFAGKLLLHTVRFRNSCGSVVFLTNVQFDDSVEDIGNHLCKSDFTSNDVKALVAHFNEAIFGGHPLTDKEIKENLNKLIIRPGLRYLDPHDENFNAVARSAIYRYSEIDLKHIEFEGIIDNLIRLVERKSFKKFIAGLDEKELDDSVGVGILDMLDILSISRGAYEKLFSGGDPHAIKNASIIQRKLTEAGANLQMIEYCSEVKVKWDVWLREKRHILLEYDLNFLLQELSEISNKLVKGEIKLGEIDAEIKRLLGNLGTKSIAGSLKNDLLLGGVFSAMVRSES
jgi:hypothetical protein